MFHHRYLFFSPHSGDLAHQLETASLYGQDTEVLDLLRRGTNPDGDDYYPLHYACAYNHPHSAETLIQWGADLRRRYPSSSGYVNAGGTPLHRACDNNSMACVKVLLEHHSPTGEPGCVCS